MWFIGIIRKTCLLVWEQNLFLKGDLTQAKRLETWNSELRSLGCIEGNSR